jgi:N6-adenosine-specific RNA methylase IME4
MSAADAAAGPQGAACSSTWQLQELSILSPYADASGRVVQHLPAGTLRQLDCRIFNWSNAAHISATAHTLA